MPDPKPERLAARWPDVSPLSYHCTLLTDAAGLLTGRNHHSVGMGSITEIATGAPGLLTRSSRTRQAPLAETLKLNGYNTAQFGKCHEVPVWETSPVGRSTVANRWRRLEYFYGFIGGEQPMVSGALRGHDTGRARQDAGRGLSPCRRHDDQGDQLDPQQKRSRPTSLSSSISRLAQRTLRTMCRRNGPDKIQGQVRRGLGQAGEETFARQKELGVIPPDAS